MTNNIHCEECSFNNDNMEDYPTLLGIICGLECTYYKYKEDKIE